MKNLCILGIVAVTAMNIAANADPINLSTLVGQDQTIEIGDKIFSDFNYLGTDIDSLTIEATIASEGLYFLTIAGSGSESLLHGTLTYTVSTTSGEARIFGIDQTLDPGDNESAAGAETVEAGGSVIGLSRVSSDGDLEDPEAEDGEVLEFDPESSIDVTTTLDVASGGTEPVSSFTLVQSFHQQDGETPGVPDGGLTLLLLGSALSGVALIRRRISKA